MCLELRMPIPLLNFKHFQNDNSIFRSTTHHNHMVSRGTFPGNPKTWFAKVCSDPASARNEVLAQEFFRLIIPHQPETLIAKDEAQNNYYVYSEEVEGFKNLPYGQGKSFEDGTFTGLGQAVFVSVFLQEVDLKNGNIGLDKDGRVIKIDGDQCIVSMLGVDQRFDLTPKVIDSLPRPVDFATNNWLDYKSSYFSLQRILQPTITNNEVFRSEVNQAMLKICLIPDEYIERFVSVYIPDGHKPDKQGYIDLIKSRRDVLRLSAVKNESFRNYLSEPAAQDDARHFMEHMRSFQSGGEPVLASQQERSQLTIDLALQNLKLETAFIQQSEKVTTVKNAVEKEAFADLENELAMVFRFQMEMKKQAQLSDSSFIGIISRSSQASAEKTAYQNFLNKTVNPVMEKCFAALVRNDLKQLEQVLAEFPNNEKWSAFNLQESGVAKSQMDAVKRLIEGRVFIRGKILPVLDQCKDAIDKKDIPAALQALSALPPDKDMSRTASISPGLKGQIIEMKQDVTETLNAIAQQSAIATPVIDDAKRVESGYDPLLVEITKQIEALENEHCEDLPKLEMHLTTVNDCLDTVEFLISEHIKQHGASEEPLELSGLEELRSRLQKIKKTDENALNTYPKKNAEITQTEAALSQVLPQTSNNTNPAKRTIKSDYDVDSENKVTKIGEDRPGFKPE